MTLMTKPVVRCVNCNNEFYKENGVDEAETVCSDSCYAQYYGDMLVRGDDALYQDLDRYWDFETEIY